ncbi:hypothetical protein SEA_REPTAR3000_37 [Mycobacterium phage Reptar3000]|nr:hypothetical protein SEA_REPTAR3000_37 [Mycobacterium phage Reptar3000]
MRPADRAWLALVAGVVAYEVFAPRGELLSEGMDRYLAGRWAWPTRAAVVVTAAHLLNVLPDRIDPIHRLGALVVPRRSFDLRTRRLKAGCSSD